MYGCRLGLELHEDLGLPLARQIRLYKQTGFDAFFAYWTADMDVAALRRAADEEGMIFHSLHAPGGPLARHLWYQSDETENSIRILFQCLKDCADNGVPIMVLHSFYGFDLHTPTELGLVNYGIVADEARRLGVKIALENLEGEEYLAALMEYFRDDPNVGFCWDVGHEMCYTHRDLMAEHGKYIMATHLNDNLGTSDSGGALTGRDDLHLLPFDGIGDWQDISDRLNRWNFDGILMFELKPHGQPGRRESDAYARMSPEEYVAAAYMRCCRVAALYMKGRAGK